MSLFLFVDISKLVEYNPWWKAEGGIDQDPQIREFQRSSLKWRPRLMQTFDWEHDHIYTLRGPRQVGKTTMMKLLIRGLLSKGVDPNCIAYLTCDPLKDQEDLVETIDAFLSYSERRAGRTRRYLFVDEAPSIKGWERGVKTLADMGRLQGAVLLLSGSHSLDLKHSTERLPGRRGEGLVNKLLPPMSFLEYMETTRPTVVKAMSERGFSKERARGSSILRLVNGDIGQELIDSMSLYKKEIFEGFESFLISGGIIRPMEQMRRDAKIESSVYELYVSSLIGDMARWRYSERVTMQVLSSVIEKMTTRISLNSIAKENEIGSRETVSSYLQALEDSFIVRTLFGLAMDRSAPNYVRERKVYISDPFIFHALGAWTAGRTDYHEMSIETTLDRPLKGRMVEMVVADHLSRLAYDLAPSDVFNLQERLMYWRKKGSDKEVDFVLKHDGALYPVEVKYRESVDRGQLEGLHNFGKGVLVTKEDLWTHRTYSAIPAPYFLLLV